MLNPAYFIRRAGTFFTGSLLIFTSSCYPTRALRHMYAPTAENVPMFTHKQQTYADITVSCHGPDAHGGYTFSNHFGIIGSWYGRKETHDDKNFHYVYREASRMDSILTHRSLLGLGMAYYGHLDKRNHLFMNVVAGYGRGRFSMKSAAQTKSVFVTPRGDSLVLTRNVFNYNAQMNRFFFQPSLVWNKPKFKSSLSIQWTGILYTHVNSSPDPNKFGHVSNKLLSFIEPAYSGKYFINDWFHLSFQIGASINTPEIDYQYRPIIGNIGVGFDLVKLLGTP